MRWWIVIDWRENSFLTKRLKKQEQFCFIFFRGKLNGGVLEEVWQLEQFLGCYYHSNEIRWILNSSSEHFSFCFCSCFSSFFSLSKYYVLNIFFMFLLFCFIGNDFWCDQLRFDHSRYGEASQIEW